MDIVPTVGSHESRLHRGNLLLNGNFGFLLDLLLRWHEDFDCIVAPLVLVCRVVPSRLVVMTVPFVKHFPGNHLDDELLFESNKMAVAVSNG